MILMCETFTEYDRWIEQQRKQKMKFVNPMDRIEELETALERIVQWSEAYPLDIFLEPDWKKAAELLNAGGITLDAISAHCMRHVVEGVGEIARAALDKDIGK